MMYDEVLALSAADDRAKDDSQRMRCDWFAVGTNCDLDERVRYPRPPLPPPNQCQSAYLIVLHHHSMCSARKIASKVAVSNLPPLEVVHIDRKLWCLSNRRLTVLKMLHALTAAG